MFKFDYSKYNVFILNNNLSSLILQYKENKLVYMLNIYNKKIETNFMSLEEFDIFLNILSLKHNVKKII